MNNPQKEWILKLSVSGILKRRGFRSAVLVFGWGMAVAGMGSAGVFGSWASGVAQGERRGIENVRWRLVKLNGREMVAGAGGREGYLRLDREAGGVGMSVGCNNIGGEYELKGQRLKISPGPMTRMFCEELNQLEQDYIKAMESVTGWRVVRGRLLLLAGEKVVAEFVRGRAGRSSN